MLTADAIHKLLANADVARDPYGVAAAAVALLKMDRNDAVAAGHLTRALGVLRLAAAASLMPASVQPAGALGPGGVGGAMGGGIIPWSSRARRFAANLRALERRNAAGAALVGDAAAGLSGYELHQTADGNFQVLDTADPLPIAWLGGLADHRAITRLWQFDAKATPAPLAAAFDGLEFGGLLLHVLQTTARSFLNYSCAVYVLESDPLALAMLLHIQDLQTAIADPRTRWFIAESADDVMREFRGAVAADPGWMIPERFVRCALRERPPLPLEQVTAELRQAREDRRAALLAEVEGIYAGKTTADWHARFDEALRGGDRRGSDEGGEPLRVLGITSRYTTVLQHAMTELQSAARAAGCAMEVVMEPDDQSLEHPFLERIAAFRPDLVVQISRMRYENPRMPRNVPFLSWDQDNLPCMRTPQATASLDALTFVAGHAALHGFVYLGWPERNVILCHLAAATHRYAPRPLDPAVRNRYACDFSYVSNASGSPESLRDSEAVHFKQDAAVLFRALAERILGDPAPGGVPRDESTVREEALKAVADARLGDPSDALLQQLVQSGLLLADRAFRHETLEWVGAFCRAHGRTLRIYGAGWEKHPTLSAHAAGPAQQGEELRAITLASRINLQIIGTGILHSRLLDGLAAGGFFLCRTTPNERGDLEQLAARETVSRYIASHRPGSLRGLDQVTDAEVARAWSNIRPHYLAQLQKFPEEVVLRGLATACRLPHPLALFPELPAISFETRDAFASRALHFLEHEEQRLAMAATLREGVQRHFSYDARWAQFVGHIRGALAG